MAGENEALHLIHWSLLEYRTQALLALVIAGE